MKRMALLSVLLGLLSAPQARAVGLSLNVGGGTAHDVSDSNVSYVGFSGTVGLRWGLDRLSLAATFHVRRFDFERSPHFEKLSSARWSFDHSFHVWWHLIKEADGALLYAGPGLGLGVWLDCSGDQCGGGGPSPSAELGFRSPISEGAAFVGLFSVAGMLAPADGVVLFPELSLGLEF